MKKNVQLIAYWVLGLVLCMPLLTQAAKPVFLITPIQKAPATIYADQTTTATYRVINNTPFALNGNGVINLPNGVTQISGGCSRPFDLASGASCILTLQIVANNLLGDVRGGPKVCNTLAHPVYCALPSPDNELKVVKSTSPPPITTATISASPSTLVLTTVSPGNVGTITVLNSLTSLVYANNITADLSGASGTLSATYTNCSSVAPGSTCTIILTANGTLVSTNIPIKGTNTNSIAVTVAADQAALSVSPTSITLTEGGATQQVIITNNGPVDAYDVGAVIAATPVLGVMVSGSCPSPISHLAPNNTCLLTFMSGTTPGSTTATIAGSNTTIISESITVNPALQPAAITSFTANPNGAQPGQTVSLAWTSTDATSCTGSGGAVGDGWDNSPQPTQSTGTSVVAPLNAGNVSYSLTCTGPGGDSPLSTVTIPVQVSECGIDVSATPINISFSTSINGLCAGCAIYSPEDLIDSNLTNFARLFMPGIGIGSSVAIQAFNSALYPEQHSINILMSLTPLQITAGILNYIEIAAFNGSTIVYNTTANTLPMKGLGIFADPDKFYLTALSSAPYDSVRVRMNNGIGFIQELDLYAICISNN